MSRKTKHLLKILVTLFLVFLSFEAVIRVMYYAKYRKSSHIPEFIKDRFIVAPKTEEVAPDGRKIILCLGGSTTLGWNASKSYPAYLQDMLPDYQVINAGIDGANAVHIYEKLVDAKTKPDIIVVNTYWNTIEQFDNALLLSYENGFVKGLSNSMAFYFLFYKLYMFLKTGETLGPMQSLYLGLDRIASLGYKTIFILEPMIVDEHAWRASPQHPLTVKNAERVFLKIVHRHKNSCLLKIDNIDKEFFMDRGHLKTEGYEVEARAVKDKIEELWPHPR